MGSSKLAWLFGVFLSILCLYGGYFLGREVSRDQTQRAVNEVREELDAASAQDRQILEMRNAELADARVKLDALNTQYATLQEEHRALVARSNEMAVQFNQLTARFSQTLGSLPSALQTPAPSGAVGTPVPGGSAGPALLTTDAAEPPLFTLPSTVPTPQGPGNRVELRRDASGTIVLSDIAGALALPTPDDGTQVMEIVPLPTSAGGVVVPRDAALADRNATLP